MIKVENRPGLDHAQTFKRLIEGGHLNKTAATGKSPLVIELQRNGHRIPLGSQAKKIDR